MLYFEVAIILDSVYLTWYHIPCYSVASTNMLDKRNSCLGLTHVVKVGGGKGAKSLVFGNLGTLLLFNIW